MQRTRVRRAGALLVGLSLLATACGDDKEATSTTAAETTMPTETTGADGVLEGTLASAPRGEHGFGYDPIFYYPPYGRTLAEVSEAEKVAVAHRGIATCLLASLACSADAQQSAAPNDVAARVGDRTISMKEVDERWQKEEPGQKAQAEQALYDGRRAALEAIVAEAEALKSYLVGKISG